MAHGLNDLISATSLQGLALHMPKPCSQQLQKVTHYSYYSLHYHTNIHFSLRGLSKKILNPRPPGVNRKHVLTWRCQWVFFFCTFINNSSTISQNPNHYLRQMSRWWWCVAAYVAILLGYNLHSLPFPRKHRKHVHLFFRSYVASTPLMVLFSFFSFSWNTINSLRCRWLGSTKISPGSPCSRFARTLYSISCSFLGIYWYSFRSRSFGLILFGPHYIDHLSCLLYIY